MSTPGYFRGVIEDTYDWSATGHYVLDATTVNNLYFPRTTDIITLSSLSENIRCWAEWDNSTGQKNWKIYISDFSFAGKVYFRLQSSLINRTGV